jgi:hypothetical protein
MSNSTEPGSAGPQYREHLWPAAWVFIGTALVIPASLLVFLPISEVAGVISAVVLYGGIVVALFVTTPLVEVTDGQFTAGRARLPRSAIAGVGAYTGAEATAERGTRLDGRAWLLLRGWIPGLVHVTLNDPDDPTPYWLVSTRHPDQLAAALSSATASSAKN